jgi:hypothetical protein
MSVLRISTLFATLVMLFACASTTFYDTWKDTIYQGHPQKILVINTFQDPSIRRLFEDEIVKALKAHNVDAAVKYTVAPTETTLSDNEVISRLAKEVGADAVLITRPVDRRPSLSSAPSIYVSTRTDIYDIKSSKLIAFASAETQIRRGSTNLQSYLDEVPSFATDLVERLSQMGVF